MEFSGVLVDYSHKDLTVAVKDDYRDFKVEVFKKTRNGCIVPVAWASENCAGKMSNWLDSRLESPNILDPNDIIVLRDYQQECFNVAMDETRKQFGGGIIAAGTAFGKTLTMIKIIIANGKKAAVVLPRLELLNQWKDEINKWAPDLRVGLVQSTTFTTENVDVILCSLHTLALKDSITARDFLDVDLCVFDETHLVPSEKLSNALFKVRARCTFGITATVERKDGLHRVLELHLGKVIYSNIATEKKQSTEVKIIKYTGANSVEIYNSFGGKLNCSAMLNAISTDRVRTDLIIKELILMDESRVVLVLSDRVAQLKAINEHVPGSVLYTGKVSASDRRIAKADSRILLGTYQVCGTGFNLETINTLVFATPRSNIEQAIGRIYRKKHKITPLIIDIVDDFSIYRGMFYKRRKIYNDKIQDVVFI